MKSLISWYLLLLSLGVVAANSGGLRAGHESVPVQGEQEDNTPTKKTDHVMLLGTFMDDNYIPIYHDDKKKNGNNHHYRGNKLTVENKEELEAMIVGDMVDLISVQRFGDKVMRRRLQLIPDVGDEDENENSLLVEESMALIVFLFLGIVGWSAISAWIRLRRHLRNNNNNSGSGCEVKTATTSTASAAIRAHEKKDSNRDEAEAQDDDATHIGTEHGDIDEETYHTLEDITLDDSSREK